MTLHMHCWKKLSGAGSEAGKKDDHCKIDVVNEEKHVNFVDDFLKMDQPAATQLHRYSFDMRA